MKYQNQTKDDLVKELQKLQHEYELLKTSYETDKTSRKKAENLYKTVISNAPISIFATDEKGIFILNEGKALEKVGMNPGDNVGVSAFDLFANLKVVENTGRILTGKEVIEKVMTGESVSGMTELNNIFFDNRFSSIRDEKNQIVGMIGVATDITESKKAGEALKESGARFRNLFENSMIGIAVTSKEGKLLQANNAFARMYGYENAENIIYDLPDVKNLYCNPEQRMELMRLNLENGFVDPNEFQVRKRDGSVFHVLVSAKAIYDSDGNFLYNQTTHLDLTERKKTENKVHEAAAYARNLIEASLDPLVTINAEGKIMDVNTSTEQITGVTRDKLIGTDFADYFTKPGFARTGYKIVFSKGFVKDYPLTIRHRSGRKIDVLYNATLYKNESGEVQGVFAAARDITERKKMEEELRNSNDLLEKLNQHLQEVIENERSQLALNLHDDFGQRLTALNLDLAWLESRMGVQSIGVKNKLREMNLMIKDSIESIREISSFLRPAILYELGLVAAIEWQLKIFEKQSGIKCHLSCKPRKIHVGDNISLILYRILQESLTNIIRHSEASLAGVDLHFTQNKIEMSITDNGIGIEEEKINSLTSMGITGIIERTRSVKGSISINGNKDKGTVLKISIPLIKTRE